MCFTYIFVMHIKISLTLYLGHINTPEKEPQLTDQPCRQDKTEVEKDVRMYHSVPPNVSQNSDGYLLAYFERKNVNNMRRNLNCYVLVTPREGGRSKECANQMTLFSLKNWISNTEMFNVVRCDTSHILAWLLLEATYYCTGYAQVSSFYNNTCCFQYDYHDRSARQQCRPHAR
jgi:hypothetical protein